MNGIEYYYNNFYNPQNFGSRGFYQIPDERLVKKADVSFDPINYNQNQRGIGSLIKMLNPNPVKRGSEYGSKGPIIYLFDSTSLSRQKWRFYIWQVP